MKARVPLQQALAQRHLPALDGLRAIAVFVVIAYHGMFEWVPGDLGVSAFFVLSGFLITWLLLQEHDGSGAISLRRFYTRRVLRIFPAYYCFIAASFAFDAFRHNVWPPALRWSAVLYLVNYYNALHGHPPTSIAHAWSLSVEEQFYLLWPLLLTLLLRGRMRWVIRGLVMAVVGVPLYRSLLFMKFGAPAAYVYNAFDARFDNLAVGCLLAACVRHPRFTAATAALVRWAWLPLVTVCLIVLSRTAFGRDYHYSVGMTVDALLVAVFILQALQLYQHPAWAWLEHPVTRHIGLLSYSLYLWHLWGLDAGHQLHRLPPMAQFIAGVAVSYALASASYYLIERPFLALKKRFQTPDQLPPGLAHAAPR